MQKAKKNRQVTPAPATIAPDTSKRRMLYLGLGGLSVAAAGALAYQAELFGAETPIAVSVKTEAPLTAPFKPLPAVALAPDAANALRAAEDIVSHYARELLTPWALIHAVRGFGKDFALADGSSAVTHLCAKYAEEKEVNGKRYVAFQRNAEVHEHSFLKTFLEAGVSPDQPLRVGPNQYSLHQLGEHAQALFRCDTANWSRYEPKYLENHLPWGLIAFSWLRKPEQAVWTNAYGEQLDLHHLYDRALLSYDTTCATLRASLNEGTDETLEFRQAITKHSCFGLHAVYGFFACYRQGYRRNGMPERIKQLLDVTIQRLASDAKALDREAEAARGLGPDFVKRMAVSQEGGSVVTSGSPPAQIIEAMNLRAQIQMHGHILEAVNYGLLHKLFTLTPLQQQRVRAGEQALYGHLVKLRALELDAYRRWHSKFVSDLVISVGHAVRALKLLTPQNPDLSKPSA